MYQPLAFMVMQRFLKAGFELKEDIIKHQHNCKYKVVLFLADKRYH